MGACRTIVDMLWDTGKHKTQVLWTLQNEYVFAFHIGGVWSLSGGGETQQLAKGEGFKEEDVGEKVTIFS